MGSGGDETVAGRVVSVLLVVELDLDLDRASALQQPALADVRGHRRTSGRTG
jgi:hypothetical protein